MSASAPDPPAVAFEHLSKRYGRVFANQDISAALAHGQIVGIIGPNGAGKTTLLRQLVGLTRPSAGMVRVHGRVVVPGAGWVRDLVSYLPQHPLAVGDLTVEEALRFSARLRGYPAAEAARRAARLVEALDLGPVARRLVGTLSGGEHRLAGIATVLVAPTPVVALDEPTNELDPLMRRRVWDLVAALKGPERLVLLVSHNLLEAERLLDRVLVLHQGRLRYDGDPAALRAAVGDTLTVELSGVGGVPRRILEQVERAGVPATRDGATIRFTAPRAWALEWLGAWLREPGLVDRVRVDAPSLEDAYLALREQWAGGATDGGEQP